MFGFVLCRINKHCNVILLLFVLFISAVNRDSVMMYNISASRWKTVIYDLFCPGIK